MPTTVLVVFYLPGSELPLVKSVCRHIGMTEYKPSRTPADQSIKVQSLSYDMKASEPGMRYPYTCCQSPLRDGKALETPYYDS